MLLYSIFHNKGCFVRLLPFIEKERRDREGGRKKKAFHKGKTVDGKGEDFDDLLDDENCRTVAILYSTKPFIVTYYNP